MYGVSLFWGEARAQKIVMWHCRFRKKVHGKNTEGIVMFTDWDLYVFRFKAIVLMVYCKHFDSYDMVVANCSWLGFAAWLLQVAPSAWRLAVSISRARVIIYEASVMPTVSICIVFQLWFAYFMGMPLAIPIIQQEYQEYSTHACHGVFLSFPAKWIRLVIPMGSNIKGRISENQGLCLTSYTLFFPLDATESVIHLLELQRASYCPHST